MQPQRAEPQRRSGILNRDVVCALVLIGGCIVLWFELGDASGGTGMLPRICLVSLSILCGLLIIREGMSRVKASSRSPLIENHTGLLIAVCGLVVLCLFTWLIGFYLSVALFVPAMAYLLGMRGAGRILIASAIVFVAIWLTFDLAFKLQLPGGALF